MNSYIPHRIGGPGEQRGRDGVRRVRVADELASSLAVRGERPGDNEPYETTTADTTSVPGQSARQYRQSLRPRWSTWLRGLQRQQGRSARLVRRAQV